MSERTLAGTDAQGLQSEIARLNRIINAMMDRAERSSGVQDSDFSIFQSTIQLENRVRSRTADLQAVVHENEKINRALRESEQRFRSLANQPMCGIAIIEDGRISYSNDKFNAIFGYSADEVLQLAPADTVCESERPFVSALARRQFNGEAQGFASIFKGLRKDGTLIDIEAHSSTMTIGGKRMLIGLLMDVTARLDAEREVRTLQEKLREQSTHDALTGLFNRHYLEEALNQELILARNNGHVVSLIMSDLDHFKAINDSRGHLGGDEVLKSFGALMKRHARASDIFCRYGGEEFLLVLPQVSKQHAHERAEQLRAAIASAPMRYGEASIAVTASFGVATFPRDGLTRDGLIAAADRALYAAKSAGRNCVRDSHDV